MESALVCAFILRVLAIKLPLLYNEKSLGRKLSYY